MAWKSWSGPVWKSFAIYRFVKRQEKKEPGLADSFLGRNDEKYRSTFQTWSINYFRDPCNSAAFLFSPGTIFRRGRAAHVMRSLCNRYTHRARRRLSFVSRNSPSPLIRRRALTRSNPFHPWILSILSISGVIDRRLVLPKFTSSSWRDISIQGTLLLFFKLFRETKMKILFD